MKTLLKTALSLLAFTASSGWAETVAVITPYLAQPGTQMAIEGFEASKRRRNSYCCGSRTSECRPSEC